MRLTFFKSLAIFYGAISQTFAARRSSPPAKSGNSIRIADNQVVATIKSPSFANPHGVAFTPDGRYAYLTNENLSGNYNPHHPSEHGGNPGNVVVVDTKTFQVVKTIEVEADPTGVVVVER
jgi:DNA-binding beta-propeller fold protein YncE